MRVQRIYTYGMHCTNVNAEEYLCTSLLHDTFIMSYHYAYNIKVFAPCSLMKTSTEVKDFVMLHKANLCKFRQPVDILLDLSHMKYSADNSNAELLQQRCRGDNRRSRQGNAPDEDADRSVIER